MHPKNVCIVVVVVVGGGVVVVVAIVGIAGVVARNDLTDTKIVFFFFLFLSTHSLRVCRWKCVRSLAHSLSVSAHDRVVDKCQNQQ